MALLICIGSLKKTRDKMEFEEWNEKMFKKEGHNNFFENSLILGMSERRRVKKTMSLISPNYRDSILELGCGSGYILGEIRKKDRFSIIKGVDLSDTAIKMARERLEGKGTPIIKGNIEEINLNEKFNKIICVEVLEHTQNPGRVIDTIIRHAKKDAKIILSVPNEKVIELAKNTILKPKWIQKIANYETHENEWHIHKFDLEMFKELIKGRMEIVKKINCPFWWLPAHYIFEVRIIGDGK